MAIENTKIGGVSVSEVPANYRLSKLSLTFGIMSLVVFPIFSFPGLILGLMANAKEKPARKFYVPGILTSVISMALILIVFILVRVILHVFGLSFSDFKDIDHCMEVIADYLVSHSIL